MKRYCAVGSLVVLMMLLLWSMPGDAGAQGCAALGGVINGAECQLAGPVTRSGSFDLEAGLTLHFLNSGGSITTGGADITIRVHGDLIMEANTLISSDKVKGTSTCNTAGSIDLLVDNNATLKPGSIIRANSCTGGAIHITAGLSNVQGTVLAQGLIESVGANKNTDQPGGGPITIETPCNLTVEGKVSSRGFDPGADLVRLVGGCFVKVFGLVESTGGDHKIPVNPPNHCNGAYRPGKLPNSTTCIEIVGGDLVEINSVLPNNGEVNADHGGINGRDGRAWIDIFARGPIKIIGDVNAPFAVHANELQSGGGVGGEITIKSRDANVMASGLAISSDNLKLRGGIITIEAATDITLDDAQIQARGDFTPQNGFGTGGKISAKAFNGALSWQDMATLPASIGDVRPNGDGIPLAQRGTINLSACTTVTTTGTLFPVEPGMPVLPFPVTTIGACGGAPTFPAYIVFPDCGCQGPTACPCVDSFSFSHAPDKITLLGTNLKAVTEVRLSGGAPQVPPFSCEPTAGAIAPIVTKTDTQIVVDPGNFQPGSYKIITISGKGSCCSKDTVAIQ